MDWKEIVINAVISLFLSLITFSLGMRSGKERTDRLKLREKYREILVHFQAIYKGIIENDPKTLNDYEYVLTIKGGKHIPLIKKMIDQGDDVELNNKLIKHLNKLESESLEYGLMYSQLENKLEETYREKLSQAGINFVDEYGSWRSRKQEMGEPYNVIHKRYVELVFDPNISELLKNINETDNLCLEINIYKRNTIDNTFIHHEDLKKIDLESIFIEIKNENLKEFNDLAPVKKELEKRINKYIKSLKSRTKEPYKFWETVLNSIKDLFR